MTIVRLESSEFLQMKAGIVDALIRRVGQRPDEEAIQDIVREANHFASCGESDEAIESNMRDRFHFRTENFVPQPAVRAALVQDLVDAVIGFRALSRLSPVVPSDETHWSRIEEDDVR